MAAGVRIERVVTSGAFTLDGGTWMSTTTYGSSGTNTRSS
jgi:hypothetical protein